MVGIIVNVRTLNFKTMEKIEDQTKEFATGFKDYTISRIDYESMPCPMDTKDFDDKKMQELANRIGNDLKQWNFDEDSPYYKDDVDDAFWKEMEDCAVEMNMPYYEDENYIKN